MSRLKDAGQDRKHILELKPLMTALITIILRWHISLGVDGQQNVAHMVLHGQVWRLVPQMQPQSKDITLWVSMGRGSSQGFSAMMCRSGGLGCCTMAGCKTDKEAQKAAFCLCVMFLRVQVVHDGHNGMMLTCRPESHFPLLVQSTCCERSSTAA